MQPTNQEELKSGTQQSPLETTYDQVAKSYKQDVLTGNGVESGLEVDKSETEVDKLLLRSINNAGKSDIDHGTLWRELSASNLLNGEDGDHDKQTSAWLADSLERLQDMGLITVSDGVVHLMELKANDTRPIVELHSMDEPQDEIVNTADQADRQRSDWLEWSEQNPGGSREEYLAQYRLEQELRTTSLDDDESESV